MKKLLPFIFLLLPLAGTAHVNSPDVYYDGYAGTYHLLVTLRPPAVVPGVAQVQIRSVGSDVSEIKILPLRMIGVGAKMAPLPDPAKRSADDPQLFTGSLWIMVRGSWKVQIEVTGQKGVARRASARSLHQFTTNARRAWNPAGVSRTGFGGRADRHHCGRDA
ncbi:MAG: hypothetical protein ACJ71U_16755 [Terriglobales bacterium]